MKRRDFLKSSIGMGAVCVLPSLISKQANASSIKTFTGNEPALFHGDLIGNEHIAKEDIFVGDLLVIDDDGIHIRRMVQGDAGEWVGPNPWDYDYDKIKIEGVSAGNYKVGESVQLIEFGHQS